MTLDICVLSAIPCVPEEAKFPSEKKNLSFPFSPMRRQRTSLCGGQRSKGMGGGVKTHYISFGRQIPIIYDTSVVNIMMQ
jgi:hypothetical protein